MGILDRLFGAAPLADGEDPDDMAELLDPGDMYEVTTDGRVIIYPADDEDPDEYHDYNTAGFD